MAVETKFKIYRNGRMDAGQFVCDSAKVSLKVNSEAHVNDLDETADTVSVTSDGVLRASEFREV